MIDKAGTFERVARGLGFEIVSWESPGQSEVSAVCHDPASRASFSLEAHSPPDYPPDYEALRSRLAWKLAEQLLARRKRGPGRPQDKLVEFENLVRTSIELGGARTLLLEQSGRLRELLYVAQHNASLSQGGIPRGPELNRLTAEEARKEVK